VLEEWLIMRDAFHSQQQQQQGAKHTAVRMQVRELGGLNMLVECLLLLKEPGDDRISLVL
jgi:hypothetical protein